MHSKKAALQRSYAAPVRVSVFSVVAARAVTVFTELVCVRDTDVLVAVFFVAVRGVKILTGFMLRGATVVFTALRDVIERVVPVVRDGVFFVRDEASALNMQSAEIRIKDRIFFISE